MTAAEWVVPDVPAHDLPFGPPTSLDVGEVTLAGEAAA